MKMVKCVHAMADCIMENSLVKRKQNGRKKLLEVLIIREHQGDIRRRERCGRRMPPCQRLHLILRRDLIGAPATATGVTLKVLAQREMPKPELCRQLHPPLQVCSPSRPQASPRLPGWDNLRSHPTLTTPCLPVFAVEEAALCPVVLHHVDVHLQT